MLMTRQSAASVSAALLLASLCVCSIAAASQRVVFATKPPTRLANLRLAHTAISPPQALPITGLKLASVDGGANPRATARLISSYPGVAWAEPDEAYHLLAVDPLRHSQWALNSMHAQAGWALAGIDRLPAIAGPTIAIVDSGADAMHEDLRGRIRACAASFQGRVREGLCDDRAGHGTHVSGIAAAATGNGLGIAGVAAGSQLIECRAVSAEGAGTSGDVAACIGWAVRQKAKIVSLSLGGPDSKTIRTAVDVATASGALVVAAAGNSGTSDREFPAGYKAVVAVGAVGPNGKRAAFSNANADVEITAPGVDVLSLAPGNRYLKMTGTSMATPHVAGAAALLWQAHPTDTLAALRARLDRSVRDAGPSGRDPQYGFGVLDLASPAA